MQTKKYHLVLAVLITVLCVPCSGDTKLLPPIKQRVIGEPIEPGLIGRPHLALAGVQQMYVVIKPPDSEPNKDGLLWSKLEKSVSDKIKEETGIKIVEDDMGKMSPDVAKLLKRRSVSAANLKFRLINIPELRVDIDMLKLEHSQQYVFHIQTSLAGKVSLGENSSHFLKAAVWKVKPTMQAVSVRNMAGKVTGEVLEQVEAFIYAYIAANPQGIDRTNTNNVGTAIQNKLLIPLPQLLFAKYKYVASKNSKVFHRPGCIWAKRIKPENLVGYNSRTEAIKAGKRPCKQCKP